MKDGQNKESHPWEIIFREQRILNERVIPGYDTFLKEMTDEERKDWILKFFLAMRQEISEGIDSLDWKWWKKGENDWQNLQVELIDILHFWVSLCQLAGLNAEDAFELYNKKNQLNHERQEGGYKDGTYEKVKEGIEDNEKLFTS